MLLWDKSSDKLISANVFKKDIRGVIEYGGSFITFGSGNHFKIWNFPSIDKSNGPSIPKLSGVKVKISGDANFNYT